MGESIGPSHRPGGKDSHEYSDRHEFDEELYDRLNDAPMKWECIARELDVDVSLLSHWTSGRGPMPAYRLIKLTEALGPGLLRFIARKCGYDLVRNTNEKATRHGVA